MYCLSLLCVWKCNKCYYYYTFLYRACLQSAIWSYLQLKVNVNRNRSLPSLGGVCLVASIGGLANCGEFLGSKRGHTPAPPYRAPRPLQYISAPNSVQKIPFDNSYLRYSKAICAHTSKLRLSLENHGNTNYMKQIMYVYTMEVTAS